MGRTAVIGMKKTRAHLVRRHRQGLADPKRTTKCHGILSNTQYPWPEKTSSNPTAVSAPLFNLMDADVVVPRPLPYVTTGLC